MLRKSECLPFVKGLTRRAERLESQRPDTDIRLLTEINRGRICSRP
jgi:hypothetical protein